MAYDSWPWNETVGGEFTPDSFECEWVDPALIQESESGQVSSEPLFTDGYWIFTKEFKGVRPQGFIDFLNFYYDHRGGAPFYFRFPFELAGVPEGAEAADPGGLGPWPSEVEVGAGEAFTKLVIWQQDSLRFKRLPTEENYWEITGSIVLRQI